MIKLTARQEQILNLIKDAIENTGFPPTRAEIANELGFKSANAAEEHLQALARKGAIEISPGTSRGIRLIGAAAEAPASKVPAALLMSLPLIGRVAAGSPILAQENLEASYNVDPALFSAKPDFLLKVRGWSMRDAGIMDGDLLAVKKVDSAKNGRSSWPASATKSPSSATRRRGPSSNCCRKTPTSRSSPCHRKMSLHWKAWLSA